MPVATKQLNFDLVVIGTGPGGEGAAMQASKSGKKVAVVEQATRIGGFCTHRGTIPSKALRYVITRMTEFRSNSLFRESGSSLNVSFEELRKSAAGVIAKQVDMRQTFYDRNRVPVISGHGEFLDPHLLEVTDGSGLTTQLRSEAFVIAVGSRPYRPPEIDFSHARILDSDTLLDMKEMPQSVTIYGAGVVGCEYASMLRNCGCKVNLVNTRQKLLEFLDDEIIDALAYNLRERGAIIRHGEEYDHIEATSDEVVLHLKSGKELHTDVLLWANGRTGNTDDLGLEHLEIKPNSRGQLEVNDNFQTTQPHVYAVGDVIGFPALASAAYSQGRSAATHYCDGCVDHAPTKLIPTGIYTSPEISSLGQTERELTEAKVPYEVGHSQFKSLARAQITGQTTGMLKLLFHRETLAILGIHCFGANASEIIHIGQAIMAQEGAANSLLYFINSTFNYPTMAEAYRVAALNGYNRVR
jgi:NAD(P) transhydrogenase